MKQLSFFLFVATGLILCATLHAQQYHDAAAFGLKGNVKECKVVSAEDGSASYDPHLFSTVSFTREGKLVSWFDDPRRTKDLVLGITDVLRNKNQQPLIFEHKESSYKTEAYYFQYKGEQLAGSYNLSWEDDDIFGRVEDTRVAVISEGANNSLTNSYFGVGDVIPDFTKLIRQELYNGGDILPRLEKYVNENMSYVNEYRSFTDNYTIEGRDSHGNYTILANEDGASIKRIITYWDDEPATAKTTQVPKSTITESTPRNTVAPSKTTGIRVVDLGLPSGVKWADRNIGASRQEDYGNYYAWGETAPKATYSWDNYVFGKEGSLKKYNDADNKLVLDPGDDVVSAELGSSWRMPTEEEMNELKANCTWILTNVNGVKGFELKSKINGNSIFLPAGGYYKGNQAMLKGGSGYYWTSTLDESLPDNSEHLNFDDFSGKQYVFLKDRYFGMLIRPVSAETKVAEPSQAPKAEEAPAKEAPSGFRSATPKELSFHDILNRPFGVLPTDRWRCSMDQILSELSRYGWKTITDKKISSSYTIKLDNKSGYDLSILGVIPFSVMAWFSDSGKELSSMWYSLSLKNHKETLRFCDRLISSLRSEGVNLPEPTKYATEVSAKYGKSIVRVKFPSKGSTVSFLQIDY